MHSQLVYCFKHGFVIVEENTFATKFIDVYMYDGVGNIHNWTKTIIDMIRPTCISHVFIKCNKSY